MQRELDCQETVSRPIEDMNLYEVMDAISICPGVYLGTPTATNLDMFLVAFCMGRSTRESHFDENARAAFRWWFEKKYNTTLTLSIGKILLLDHNGNEKEALADYLRWWQKFAQETGRPEPGRK